jgi:hypothetical protein
MVNYKIEGGINFFDELYKSLDEPETVFKSQIDDTKCLITNEVLTSDCVTMECGHKFNYMPLYKDLVNYKQKFNNHELSTNVLKKDEIHCPYCRNKQKKLLPFLPDYNLPIIPGVNANSYNDENIIKNYKKCEFLMPNKFFEPTFPETEPNSNNLGNCKYVMCNCYGSKFTENTNGFYVPNNDKNYCYKHKKIIFSEYNKELKKKEKEELKNKKLEEKEAVKKKKLEEKEEVKKKKLEEKEDTKKKKQEEIKKKKMDEIDNLLCVAKKKLQEVTNPIINEDNMILDTTKCVQILKTGPNKGNQCNCKIYMNNMCRRHYVA